MPRPNKITPEVEAYIHENLRYDPETGHLWWTKRGGATRKMDSPAGHRHAKGYREINLRFNNTQHRVMEHRVAWFMYYGEWPEHLIDHINQDKSDNRIENIRLATYHQNAANRPKQNVKKDSHKNYIGVIQIPSGRWRAMFMAKHVGMFDTPEEAARARDAAAKAHNGEYAYLNFPDE
jgi:hypothetical protein